MPVSPENPPNMVSLFPVGHIKLLGRYLAGIRILSSWMGADPGRVRELYREFAQSRPFGGTFRPLRCTDHYKAAVLYTICRVIRPRVVVETGVASGTSAVGILSALERNSSGVLHSVDLPSAEYVTDSGVRWRDTGRPSGPGWIIPANLRSRWVLHLGSSWEMLPELLDKVGMIDLFYHDSEHTRATMDFEFNLALNHMSPLGGIAADNSNWSTSFPTFCAQNDLQPALLFPFLGLCRRKPNCAGARGD